MGSHDMLSKIFLLSVVNVLAFTAAIPLAGARETIGPEETKTVHGNESREDEAELRRLMAVLEKHTEIATKTRMNADFVPGMVTVLEGDELEARGARTVFEALALIPGVELSIQSSGDRQIIVRGVGKVFGSGKTKILLNGVSMNSAFLGRAHTVLELPVEQVERIEVIRGPGSALYGEYAINGVVNVTTRKAGNRVFADIGSNESYGGGGLISYPSSGKTLKLSLNLYGSESDGEDVKTGPDRLYNMGLGGVSNAPGPANEDRDSRFCIFTMEYKDFSLLANFLEVGLGDHFGVADALPGNSDRIAVEQENRSIEARQGLDILPSLWGAFKLGYMEYRYQPDKLSVFPPGFAVYADGITASPYCKISEYSGGLDLTWKEWSRHTVLLGWSFSRSKIEDSWNKTNRHPVTGAPLPSRQYFDGNESWLVQGKDRLLNSITFQDEFRANRMLSVTAGLRYDHYDDVGSSLSPRLAAVYRLTNEHVIKVQYAHAFRPPTFSEMYAQNNSVVNGNPDIDPETIDTYELGYIYSSEGTVGRATLFYSDIDDLVVVESGNYTNSGGARLAGVELELQQELGAALKLDANISYVDTEDRDTHEDLEGSTDWLANLGLLYQPVSDLLLSVQYRYVGDRNRDPQDSRAELQGDHVADITGSLFNLMFKGLTFRAGIRNLLDHDVYYFAPIRTYEDDYPRSGRTWWVSFGYQF